MYDELPDPRKPVAEWTLAECDAYVGLADESYGERYAEAGSGAVSLGYNTDGAYEAANAVSRPTDDPKYREASERLRAAVKATLPPVSPNPFPDDDIPF